MSTLEYEIEDQWISDDNIRRRILKAYDDEQKTRKFAQYESAESSVVRRVSSGRNRAFRKRTRWLTLIRPLATKPKWKNRCTDKSCDTNAILDMKYDADNDVLYFVDSNGFLTQYEYSQKVWVSTTLRNNFQENLLIIMLK